MLVVNFFSSFFFLSFPVSSPTTVAHASQPWQVLASNTVVASSHRAAMPHQSTTPPRHIKRPL
jgi:hypothetical protein